jgi:hypothetical protein
MPATTPTQGFPYPLASDRPCDYPATMALLAQQLDTKMAGFDTDVARLTKRPLVKISRSSFSYPTNGNDGAGDVAFDTVEVNNGTPTDLTSDAYTLHLTPGFWVLQAKVIAPTASSGQDYSTSTFILSGATSQLTRSFANSRDFGNGISTIAIQDFLYATSADSVVKVGLSFSQSLAATLTVTYATLGAWWIADV